MKIMLTNSGKCLTRITTLIKEVEKTRHNILLVEYKGLGKFSVNIFCDLGSEVQYVVPDKPSWKNVSYQGKFNILKIIRDLQSKFYLLT